MEHWLDSNNRQRLVQLRKKIEENTAMLSDYEEYERLLVQSGVFSNTDVRDRLNNYGYQNWEQYKKARPAPSIYGRRREFTNTEGKILGGILGLGLAAILLSALAEKSK